MALPAWMKQFYNTPENPGYEDIFEEPPQAAVDPNSAEGMNVFGGLQKMDDPAMVSGQFDQSFIDSLFANLDRTSALLPGSTPQMDLSQVPQPVAERMLGGYDPATLAQMKAGANEGASRSGIQELSQVRQQLSRAGLSDSPASAAYAGDVARRTGMAQNDANREIDISNAGMQMQNQQSGLAAANAMALANANRMFDAMAQNQAAQMSMTGAKSNLIGQFGSQLTSAQLGKQTNADTTNAAAQNNQNDLEFGAGENRWQTGVNALSGLAGGGTGAFQPTQSTAGNILGGIGSSMLDQGLGDIFGTNQPAQQQATVNPNILTDQMGPYINKSAGQSSLY